MKKQVVEGYDLLFSTIMRHRLKELVRELPERRRQIIELRFGIRGCRPHTPREIAEQLSVTEALIKNAERQILRQLEHSLFQL